MKTSLQANALPLNFEQLKPRLKKSKFRSRFRLNAKDLTYLEKSGVDKIASHAQDFIAVKLGPAFPLKDGKQTPMRGHPVFKAQHATATCCRGCLEKWYRIPKGRPLARGEQRQIVQLILDWIRFKRNEE